MNIFHKVALQSLRKNRTRTAVTIIGVILSAAMITAVITFGVSLLHYMAQGAAQKYGDWHVAFLDADPAFAQEQAGNEAVAGTATFENIGYAPLADGGAPNKPYLFIAGFHEKTFDTLPITLLSGRLPENCGELLVSGRAATEGGVSYAVGDTVSFSVGDRVYGDRELGQGDPYTPGVEMFVPQEVKAYTVVGICATPVFEGDAAPGYTMITRSDGAAAMDSLSVFVTLKNPRRVHAYARSAAGAHAYLLNHDVLRIMGLSDDPADKVFNALLHAFGGIIIAIIMIGSIFLIYNSFSISLNERMRQIGLFASMGATAKQLRNSVLFEGLCIGIVGIPLGVLAGLGSIGLVIAFAAKNFSTIFHFSVPLTLHLSVSAILGAAVISLVTILISAYIPAKKAAGTPVMECIRQTNAIKVEPKAIKTPRLAQRIYGLEGVLALKNFKRDKKRYRSIILSLILSIVLFLSTSALVMDLKRMSEQADVVTDYDIGFGVQDMDNGEMLALYNRLKTVEGVTQSSYQTDLEYTCTVPADALSNAYWKTAGTRQPDGMAELSMVAQFLDDNTYLGILGGLGLPAEEYTGQNAKIIAVAKIQARESQAEGIHGLPDLFANNSTDVTLIPHTNGELNMAAAQNANITCVETVPPDTPPSTANVPQQPYFLQVMLPYSRIGEFIPANGLVDTRVKGFTFQSSDPPQSMAAIKTVIQDAGVSSAYLLLNTSELLEENRSYIFVANLFAYTFILMISLIAVANVFNTISTNIKLRRRELAMLRSVGMSDRDFNKMMRFECVFYGVKALLYGLPLAVVCAWFIHSSMVTGQVGFTLPWGSIGISILGVFLVIFITMLYAVGKIRKENIIDALRDDMA